MTKWAKLYIILHRGSLLSEVIVEVLTVNVRQVARYSRCREIYLRQHGTRTKFRLNTHPPPFRWRKGYLRLIFLEIQLPRITTCPYLAALTEGIVELG